MATANVGEMLGVPLDKRGTPLGVAGLVEKGLALSALDRVAEAIAPGDPQIKYRFVPKATLARRRLSPSGRLTTKESDKVARVAKVLDFAQEIFQDDDKARRFLSRRHPMLAGKPPIDVALATGAGADEVINLLGRAAYSGGV